MTVINNPSAVRQINQAGLQLIKEFEGLRLTAYQDSVKKWTIGYGHTKNVHKGDTITQQKAEEFLNQDWRVAATGVTKNVKVSLNDNQFAALVSFVFNLGADNLASSTLLKELNAGNYQAAADQLLRWNHAGKSVMPGLTKRREAERKLFLS